MFPQIIQSSEMLNPESHGGPTVPATQNETPADFNDMLHPGEQRPKRFSAVRKAGIKKVAQAQGIPDHLIDEMIEQMEKDALGWGKTLLTAGKALFGGAGKAATRTGGKLALPSGSGWERAKRIVGKKWSQREAMKKGRPTGMRLQVDPKTGQKVLPTKPSAEPMGGLESQRLRQLHTGEYADHPVYQRLLRKHQTGAERFMSGVGGTLVRDVAPWIVLPMASEMLGLGTGGQLAAMGGAMVLPGMIGKKFQAGTMAAKSAFSRGAMG